MGYIPYTIILTLALTYGNQHPENPEHRTPSTQRPGSFDTLTNSEPRKGISQYLPSLFVGITIVSGNVGFVDHDREELAHWRRNSVSALLAPPPISFFPMSG